VARRSRRARRVGGRRTHRGVGGGEVGRGAALGPVGQRRHQDLDVLATQLGRLVAKERQNKVAVTRQDDARVVERKDGDRLLLDSLDASAKELDDAHLHAIDL